MKGSVTINVCYGELFDSSWQTKRFKSLEACVQWCQAHHEKILALNDYRTSRDFITEGIVLRAINGVCN